MRRAVDVARVRHGGRGKQEVNGEEGIVNLMKLDETRHFRGEKSRPLQKVSYNEPLCTALTNTFVHILDLL